MTINNQHLFCNSVICAFLGYYVAENEDPAKSTSISVVSQVTY